MNIIARTTAAIVVIAAIVVTAAAHTTTAPDSRLKVKLETPDSGYGTTRMNIEYNGQAIVNVSEIGIETDRQRFHGNLKLKNAGKRKTINESYTMLTGKRMHCRNKGNEQTYTFENDKGQTMDVRLRVYNDGVAIKYILNTKDSERITGEYTTYCFPDGTRRWMQKYDDNYENFFPLTSTGIHPDSPEINRWGYPALAEPVNGLFVLLTESGIRRGHCGSLLSNAGNRNDYRVTFADNSMTSNGKWESPWRVIIAGKLVDIVESTLVTDVADPAKSGDTGWIKPGVAAWIYWANNHGSRDFKTVKEYIDLAEAMKWPYNLIDAEWDEMGNGGNIDDALKYSAYKNVRPMIWYNSGTAWCSNGAPGPIFRLNKREDRLKEYKWLQDNNVAGVKIDFFSGDHAATMDYCIDLLEDATDFRLMVNFHGATIPRGWQRTYPHMMTVEGVYGAEWYNNLPVMTNRAACHNATLPFTRNVVGPMDYTPGTFSDSQHPHITSHGHELALTILYESALQHMPDRPETYYSMPEPVKKLLSSLPTVWDDTRLLAGYPGVDAVIARRKGKVWYIAGINGTDSPRTLQIDTRLPDTAGKSITLIKDGNGNRSFCIEENVPLAKTDRIQKINCLPRGGFVAIVK